MDAQWWDEVAYRRRILRERDLSCRTLFRVIFFDHHDDPRIALPPGACSWLRLPWRSTRFGSLRYRPLRPYWRAAAVASSAARFSPPPCSPLPRISARPGSARQRPSALGCAAQPTRSPGFGPPAWPWLDHPSEKVLFTVLPSRWFRGSPLQHRCLFAKYGRIVDIDLKIPPKPPGYGFVEFEDPHDAEDAVAGWDGYNFDRHRLRVEPAHGGRGHGSSNDRSSSFGGGGRRGVSRHLEYRVLVTGLPSSASWQDLKDHMRRAGEVCFSEVYREGSDFNPNQIYNYLQLVLHKRDSSMSHQLQIRLLAYRMHLPPKNILPMLLPATKSIPLDKKKRKISSSPCGSSDN